MPESSEAEITLSGDLHARPAGMLAVAAAGFASAVQIVLGDASVDAKSVLLVMGLGASNGQRVLVRATGPDASQAVATLIEILAAATPVGG